MSLLSELSQIFGEAFSSVGLDAAYGEVVPSQRPELGQFQCNGALSAGNQVGRNPTEIAEEVIHALVGDERLGELSVAGPGFINVSIADHYLVQWATRLVEDERGGVSSTETPERIVLDYGGPNISKAMHIGHIRATIIGDALKRLFRFLGHEVLGDIHLGDWGTPIGLLVTELQRRRPELPYFDQSSEGPYPDEPPMSIEDLQAMYPVAVAKADADPQLAAEARRAGLELQAGRPGYVALWQHISDVSRASHEADFAALGVEFELWYGESTVADRIEELVATVEKEGVAEESEGALILRVDDASDQKEIPPLMLTRSDGGYLYGTTDLATIDMRVRDIGADCMLYVVDARQALHFTQVFRAARATGIAPEGIYLEHVPFGTVNGPDGKPFRTREGDVVLLNDVIEMVQTAAAKRLEEAELAQNYPAAERAEIARQVGLAALKFGDLMNHRSSNYVFDLDRFTSFEGKTGPYLQYGAVRMKSILRKAADRGFRAGPLVGPQHPSERDLLLLLMLVPEVVERSVENRAPNHIAEFAYDTVTQFNRFYDHCHILSQTDRDVQSSWLTVVSVTLNIVELLVGILGIEVPDRM